MSDIVVLVPNWSPLSPDMEAETGSKYAAFIPLGGVPLYKHIISQYEHEADRVRFVFLLAEDAPAIDPLESAKVVRLKRSGSIGETLLTGLSEIAPGAAAVVHMGDTLVDID